MGSPFLGGGDRGRARARAESLDRAQKGSSPIKEAVSPSALSPSAQWDVTMGPDRDDISSCRIDSASKSEVINAFANPLRKMRSLFQTCKILWLSKSLFLLLLRFFLIWQASLPASPSPPLPAVIRQLPASPPPPLSRQGVSPPIIDRPPPLPVRTSLWVSKKVGRRERHRQRPIHWRPRNVEGRREGRSSSHPLLLFLAMDIEEKGSKDSPNAASGKASKSLFLAEVVEFSTFSLVGIECEGA